MKDIDKLYDDVINKRISVDKLSKEELRLIEERLDSQIDKDIDDIKFAKEATNVYYKYQEAIELAKRELLKGGNL